MLKKISAIFFLKTQTAYKYVCDEGHEYILHFSRCRCCPSNDCYATGKSEIITETVDRKFLVFIKGFLDYIENLPNLGLYKRS